MSSTTSIQPWKNITQFRYVDFLIKSTPAISLAFMVYVTFRGVLW